MSGSHGDCAEGCTDCPSCRGRVKQYAPIMRDMEFALAMTPRSGDPLWSAVDVAQMLREGVKSRGGSGDGDHGVTVLVEPGTSPRVLAPAGDSWGGDSWGWSEGASQIDLLALPPHDLLRLHPAMAIRAGTLGGAVFAPRPAARTGPHADVNIGFSIIQPVSGEMELGFSVLGGIDWWEIVKQLHRRWPPPPPPPRLSWPPSSPEAIEDYLQYRVAFRRHFGSFVYAVLRALRVTLSKMNKSTPLSTVQQHGVKASIGDSLAACDNEFEDPLPTEDERDLYNAFSGLLHIFLAGGGVGAVLKFQTSIVEKIGNCDMSWEEAFDWMAQRVADQARWEKEHPDDAEPSSAGEPPDYMDNLVENANETAAEAKAAAKKVGSTPQKRTERR